MFVDLSISRRSSFVSLLDRRIADVTILLPNPCDVAAAAVTRSIARSVSSKVAESSFSRVENELPDIVRRSASTDEVTYWDRM